MVVVRDAERWGVLDGSNAMCVCVCLCVCVCVCILHVAIDVVAYPMYEMVRSLSLVNANDRLRGLVNAFTGREG